MKKPNIKLRQAALIAVIAISAIGGVSSYLSKGHVEFTSAMAYTAKKTDPESIIIDAGSGKTENGAVQNDGDDAEYTAGADASDQTAGHSKEAIINGKVNLNAASLEQLQIAPGIGPAKAQKIIEYREAYGGFSCVEELTEVSGIGEKTLAKIKDYYCAE